MSTRPSPPNSGALSGVRDVVAVHSAKGGVGKSTIATNLAVTFARLGLRVGLLDADVHGPSVAHMMGSRERPHSSVPGRVQALERHGVRYLSLDNVAPPEAPLIWRGPMVAGAIQELLAYVDWGERDLLLIDMPPGTGDALLGVGQGLELSGVISVTTPQELSLSDTRRGIRAFAELRVPCLGIVENMASFTCDACGESVALFGEGGGRRAAGELEVPFLGSVPLEPAVCEAGDAGRPIAASNSTTPAGTAIERIARKILSQIALRRHTEPPGGLYLEWGELTEGTCHPEPPETQVVPSGAGPAQAIALWQASDRVLGILWADGERTFHGAYELRSACPCAQCRDEITQEKLPSLERVPREVRPVTIRSVGRYALQPVWSDGHRTGMFTLRELRAGAGRVDPPH